MANNTEIPRKYIPALCYYAAGLIAESLEMYDQRDVMFNRAEKVTLQSFSADDEQFNTKRIERVGV